MKSLRRKKESNALNPYSRLLFQLNKTFIVCCLVAVCLDPLFFYIPLVNANKLCLSLDNRLSITFCVLRSFIDLFHVFHIYLKFRTGFVDPSSRSDLVVADSRAIRKRYLQSFFIIDILSILPLPQVVTLIVPAVRSWVKIRPLTITVIAQNIVRILRIPPLLKEAHKMYGGILTETAWGETILNFCLYLFSSHVLGSFWYLGSIERADECWRAACNDNNSCNLNALYCGGASDHGISNNSFLLSSCSPFEPSKSAYDYGVFRDALSLQLYTDFFRRFFYCFVWGLRNLSSLGQNLETSNNNVGENLFVVLISVNGLILFSILAGNIQRCLQSVSFRLDEMVVKKRDQEQWMSRSNLPLDLTERVRRHEQFNWRMNRGVDEESLIRNLPKDLRRDIKRHKYRSLLIRVPMFEKMDEMLLDALCCRLKPVLYAARSCIFREGDSVDEMLFIKRGKILSTTTNVCGNEPFNTRILKDDDFCGEELLTWALDPNSSSFTLPVSTTTVRALTCVEAFILMPDDLKCVVSGFRYLHSDQLHEHILRYYSEQWRSWGAGIIQAAWRQYYYTRKPKYPHDIECIM